MRDDHIAKLKKRMKPKNKKKLNMERLVINSTKPHKNKNNIRTITLERSAAETHVGFKML